MRKADKETPPALGQAVTQERVGLTGTLPQERVGLTGTLPQETVGLTGTLTQERVGLTGTLPPERVGLAGALPRETVLAGRISLDDEALKCINMKHDAIMIVYKL